MKNYESPVVLGNEELAEGVFTASGAAGQGTGCWIVDKYYTTQTPEEGRLNNVVHVDAHHAADHNCRSEYIVITFDKAVNVVENEFASESGNGTNRITLFRENGWANHTENLGFSGVKVVSVADSNEVVGIVDVYIDDADFQQ